MLLKSLAAVMQDTCLPMADASHCLARLSFHVKIRLLLTARVIFQHTTAADDDCHL